MITDLHMYYILYHRDKLHDKDVTKNLIVDE